MNTRILAQIVTFGIILTFGLLGCGEEPAKVEQQSRNAARDEAKKDAMARALVVLKQMGFDSGKYICIPLDKNESKGVLNDSDIRPYVAPVALESDWWMVLFIPEKKDTGPCICVYLDKHSDVVRGYLIGPSTKPMTP